MTTQNRTPIPPELKAAIAANTGHVAVATLLLAAVALAGFAATTAFAVTGLLSLWVVVPINGYLMFVLYSPLHEAVHRNISSGRARWRRFEDVVGGLCGFVNLVPFTLHRWSHLQHHAHTNKPGDPDLHVAGSPARFPRKVVRNMSTTLLPRRRPTAASDDLRSGLDRLRINRVGWWIVIAAFVATGHVTALLAAIVVPWFIGHLLLTWLFQWVPHRAGRTERFHTTRLYRFPTSRCILVAQDRHLIHHLWPRIPFSRYRSVLPALQPVLDEQHVETYGIGALAGRPHPGRP